MQGCIPRVIALSPHFPSHPNVVVAAGRAGALGVLDLAPGRAPAEGIAATAIAARLLGERPFGVRLPQALWSGDLLRSLPQTARVVWVHSVDDGDWGETLDLVKGSGRLALAEACTREAAWAAADAGCDGLILSGHEAGGQGGEESSYILLQAVLGRAVPPVWVRGGVGPRVASACLAMGAAGVVLEGALLLARESPLDDDARGRVARWDGSETVVLGRATGHSVRVHAAPGTPALVRLKDAEAEGPISWRRTVETQIGWGPDQAWPVGPEASWAGRLAARHVTVGGIVQAVERAMDEGVERAEIHRPLAEGAALAEAHRTRYPVVQGPMTRVSDTAAFAEAVAEGGGLPFVALALMRRPDVRALLEDTRTRLGKRSWGVGLLGFVPPDLRREQIEEILTARPPFALIAGGRPDQAAVLERAGIATYLHVPSPGLLRQYLGDGARRFVLEGRECGGHVGPRSSFVLWEQAVDVIEQAIDGGAEASELHVLFAGGIHDTRSAAGVAALAGPLAARGVKIGLLAGTAYLFTAEAVATGAIVPRFQAEAVRCTRTLLLETGPGHEVRVGPSPFTEVFETERRRLLAARAPAEEVRETLEGLNVGRLRVASKGLDRPGGDGALLAVVPDSEQAARGLYMLGQAATLRQEVTSIAALHHELSAGATDRIERLGALRKVTPAKRAQPSDVAIVGMAAIAPGAGDVRTFWENTLRGFDAITEVPEDRWNWRLYYDPDPKAPDKIISKWGGFIPDVPFDPLRYGMPPTSLPSIEPMHLLTLEAVRAALDDAGYGQRAFPRERTAVVLGAGGGAAQLAMGYAFRSYLPLLDTVIPGGGREALERSGAVLPEWTEDSFPGILLNVAAGRVANRFDLGGANYTVDAACGSSLAAAAVAVRELETGAADMVILGGADTVQNPFTYLAFSKTHAFSPRGRCRPFDASADGIVISEGVAVVVLKRLADAERDGDRIYAVIKGLGASSDGRARGLTAPRPEGQIRAVERAYEKAGVSPATVGYVEAHGTGTAAGDLSEVQSLAQVFREAGANRQECALGSVKSLIGHTKCAAGLMGLINASLALHHEVLPPTIGVQTPNPRIELDGSPFRISTRTRPWLHASPGRPRRAGVSAFGFGGTNFHAVLEAYEGSTIGAAPAVRDWPAELLAWQAPSRMRLDADLKGLEAALANGSSPALRDLAHTLSRALPRDAAPSAGCFLAIVAESLADLRDKLARARRVLAEGHSLFHDPRGLDFAERTTGERPKVAFLFPGQGAQALDMLNELAVTFPDVRRGFEAIDEALVEAGLPAVSSRIFPPATFRDDERERLRTQLNDTQTAQPALAAACVGLLRQLNTLGVAPDVAAGHSFGEFVALHAAGAYSAATLARLAEARGRLLKQAAGTEPGAMAAVAAGSDQIAALLDGIEGVWPANWNGPRQTVVSGTSKAIDAVVDRARAKGLRAQRLAVSCAFHSPLVSAAEAPLAALAGQLGIETPKFPVFSNVTAAPHNGAIPQRLGQHLAQPVRFADMVLALYEAGARVFLEVGPGATLTSLVDSILSDRPHLAVACDPPARRGLAGLLQALGRLYVAGVPVRLGSLTQNRGKALEPGRFTNPVEPLSATTWLVNGTRARPVDGVEPRRLGPGPALPVPATPAFAPPSAVLPQPPARNGKAPHGPLPASAKGDAVFEAFQQTMRSFLDLQKEAMLGFLGGSADDAGHAPAPERVSDPPTNPRFTFDALLTPPRHGRDTNGHSENGAAQRVSKPAASHSNGNGVHPPAAPPAADHVSLADRLLAIVRDRTGYPAEMLGLELDLEADLGIDSIKRVEILGSLRDVVGPSGAGFDSALMDQLSREKTLGGIVRRVTSALPTSVSTNGHGAANGKAPHSRNGTTPEPVPAELTASPIRRLTLEVAEAPLARPFRPSGLLRGGIVLVTEDGRGVARAIAFDLRARGYAVVRVQHEQGLTGPVDADVEAIDMSSPSAVAGLIARLRRRGPVAGLIHALPLRSENVAVLDLPGWAEKMGPEVRGLFLLARELADDLEQAAKRGGACLIAATALGGAFASVGTPPGAFFPGQGGIAGLVKTLAHEWPLVRARVVDVDADASIEVVAANLVQEIFADDRYAEIGYHDGGRWRLNTREAELKSTSAGVALEPGEPILITGGARGITAAVAESLAETWRPTLLLVGTSPLPPEHENPATKGVTEPAALKALLLDELSRNGRKVSPAELERAYSALRHEREIRENLRRLRARGATVEYASADVRDTAAMRRRLEAWRARFGPIAGLVHGAGVIQDKLLRDKTPESFDRVVSTKLKGALTLASLLDHEPPKFAAFFSSVAGRFGNKGQSDYAAANDALNKFAIWLDRRWAGRVVSLIWGPWSGVGMVSDLEAHLGRRGLGMIPPEEGRSRLVDELRLGRKGDVEVIIAGDLGALIQPTGPQPAPAAVGPRVKEPAR